MYPAGELAVFRQLLFKKAMGILLTPPSVGLTIPPNIQGLGVILDIIMRYFEVYSI